ncbi:slit homolog 3 protein [Lingula anatina]|uniref:Slit homolog 3 protein n=1 Tax=Lingula anatina TaxID=7574 RepID=A0A1S3H9A6_LINAN|nr:slit homolog 3 protein [Lingula anatina]|eukprot:XP_013382061.1 slit homolog 3 protein [Lingula anatina]
MILRSLFMSALAVGLVLLISRPTDCQTPTPWSPVCPYECVCFWGASIDTKVFNGTYMNCTFRRRGPFPVGEVPEDTVILDLSFNEMGKIPTGAFDKILHLQGVWLEGNHLSDTKVSQGVFDPLKYLQIIDLSFNDYTRIPQNVPETIKQWYFVTNKITHLSSTDLDRYPLLETLQLSNNNMTYIPVGFFAKQKLLSVLQISSNPLTSAGTPHGVFKDAISLSSLELKSDKLTRIPSGLPENLQTLDLSTNNIGRLYSSDFVGISRLGGLELSSNEISAIGTGVFSSLINLKTLGLSNNYLTHLTDGLFDGLASLGGLELSSNEISAVDTGVFSSLINLKDLGLSNNHLTYLNDGMFDGLASLESISLYGNKMIMISDNAFVPLRNLATIDLDSNSLETLQYEVYYNPPFKNLTSLFISSNPWNCDCRLRWLRELVDLKPYLMLPEFVKCVQPPYLQNLTWDILFPEDFVSSLKQSGKMILRSLFVSALAVGLVFLIGTDCQTPTPWSPVCPYECVCFWGASIDAKVFNGTYMNCTIRRRGTFPVGEVPEDTVILDLSFNEMGQIPTGAFDKILHLQGVWLEGNHLSDTKVSQGVFDPLKYLQIIDLSFNDYTRIPQNVPETIKQWYFVTNKITHLSSTDLDRYPLLETLQLSNNNMTYIPVGFFAKQTLLSVLQISSNPLTSAGIPYGVFKDAITLTSLELKSDNLTRIPSGLPEALQTLDLSTNNIGRLYSSDFIGISRLGELELSSNEISAIDTGVFSSLINLKTLGLSNNHLTHLSDGMFDGLASLESISLYGNKMIMISDNAFVPLRNLATIDLDSNSLETLQYEVYYNPPFKNLTSLFISSNPWNCDCRLRWLRELVDLKPYLLLLPEFVKCVQPPYLQNLTWDILFPEDFVC